MINNRRTICILGGTGTVGVTACKVLSKLGYSLRVSVRNIETIKDTGMYMAVSYTHLTLPTIRLV